MISNYKTFDVVLVDFGKIDLAGEIGGIRPAVIVQNELGNVHSPCTIVLAFTSQHRSLPQSTHSLFKKDPAKGLTKDSVLLGECVRQISEQRIQKKLGEITKLEDKKEVMRAYIANLPEL